MDSPIRNTINHLKLCRRARAAGYQVAFNTDPAWLVNMAINRRAGWPDDPSHYRGSCMPVNGRYPVKAEGDGRRYSFRHLRSIAYEINSRVIVREQRLGEWKDYLLKRIPHRITRWGEE